MAKLIPVIYRQSVDGTRLRTAPYISLELITSGDGSVQAWRTVAEWLSTGLVLSAKFMPQHTDTLSLAVHAICDVNDRHKRMLLSGADKTWGATLTELTRIREGFKCTETLIDATRTRDQRDALLSIYTYPDTHKKG